MSTTISLEETKSAFKAFKLTDLAVSLLVFILFNVLFFRKFHFPESSYLLLVTSAIAWYLIRKQKLKLNNLDFAIVTILIYECISFFCRISSLGEGLPYIQELITAFLFYLMTRVTLYNRQRWFCFIVLLLLFITAITTTGYIQFLFFYLQITQVFTNDISSFKGLFFPFNYLVNDWSGFLVCFFGILYLSVGFFENRNLLLWLLAPIIAGILISFSRGAYLSLLVTLPVTIIVLRYHRGKKITLINTFFFLFVLVAMLLPFLSSIQTTFKFNETLSQTRSTVGRYQLLQIAKDLFFNNWAWGVGNGNFSLRASRYFEDDNIQFTSRVTNSLVQALCEKGLFGTLVWSLPVFLIMYELKEHKTIKYVVAVTAFLVILFVKEMTFSTFFESIEMKLMVMIAFAYHAFYTEQERVKMGKIVKIVTPIILLVLLFATILIYQRKKDADLENNLIFTTHDFREMLKHSNKASALFPFEPAYNINKTLIYWKGFLETSDKSFLDSAETYAEKSIAQSPYDFQLQANLYWINYYQGEKQAALDKMKYLSQQFPDKSIYALSVAEMLNQNGFTDKSIPFFLQAVKRAPAILENLRNYDSELYIRIAEEIVKDLGFYKKNKGTVNLDPIQNAKDAQLFLIAKDTSWAEIILRKVNSFYPNMTRAYLSMSLINLKKGNKEEYIVDLRKAELLARNDYLVLFYMSEYLAAIGNNEGSKAMLSYATRLYNTLPSPHNSKALNWYTSRIFNNDILPETMLYKIIFPIRVKKN